LVVKYLAILKMCIGAMLMLITGEIRTRGCFRYFWQRKKAITRKWLKPDLPILTLPSKRGST